MAIPDYSNIKFDMSSMNTFFKDQGVNVAAGDSAKLNTIFKECDTEGAKNSKGEKKGDGVLNGQERATFLSKIKSACPQLYDKIVDFFTTVETTEDIAATDKETRQKLTDAQKANDKARTEEKIKNTGNYEANINQWQKEAAKEVERNRAEAEKEVEKLQLLDDFRAEWTGEVDNKTLTAQLAELENIKDKDTLDKKLMEYNIQNRNYDVE